MIIDDTFISNMTQTATNPDDADPNYFITKFTIFFYLGEMMGSLLSYLLSDNIGRKATLLYCSILGLFVIGWGLFMVESLDNMLTLRVFLGVIMGLLVSVAPVYCAELSRAENRGMIGSVMSAQVCVGSIVAIVAHYLFRGNSRDCGNNNHYYF